MAPNQQIDAILADIIALFNKATALADEHNVSFSWDHFGYGFSGSYIPKTMTYQDAIDLIESGADISPATRARVVEALQNGRNGWESSDATGWVSSSANC